MNKNRLFTLFFLIVFSLSCNQSSSEPTKLDHTLLKGKGALLTTRFNSFEELEKVIQIEYKKGKKPWVRLTHKSEGHQISSILKSGISESDIYQTRDGSLWDKMSLTARAPFFVMHRKDLMKVYILSRRRHKIFGGGDVAFYDLAETMKNNISAADTVSMPPDDLLEKGYINTFNHIIAQALMTSIFSEELADFIADTHERTNMPELVTGNFTDKQLADIKNGPVDNYVDIINNEWGQELGNLLKKKFDITSDTYWTPELLADYLNEMQGYFSWVFQIGFTPFRSTDVSVKRFSEKINRVMEGISGVR